MAESSVSEGEFLFYFDYLLNNHYFVDEQFILLDVDERRQYSAEELALEVV